jgi:hypothetical protein
MKQVDCIVQSFDIRDDEIEFERDEEGNDLVLGHGAYGQVHLRLYMPHQSQSWGPVRLLAWSFGSIELVSSYEVLTVVHRCTRASEAGSRMWL